MITNNRIINGIMKWVHRQYSLPRRGSFFRRSLVMVILIASLPGLLIGTGIYWVGSGQITDETNRLHQQQLKQTQKSIDDQLIALETSLSHWAFDPQFDDKLKRLDFVYGYTQVQDIYKTLLVMRELNPMIKQVQLYIEEPYPLLFTEDGYHRVPEGLHEQYHSMLMQQNQAVWNDFDINVEGAEDTTFTYSLSLIHKIPGGSPRPFGMFLVSVNQSKLKEIVNVLTPRHEGTSFLLREDGEWIAPFGENSEASALNEALRKRITQEHTADEQFIFEWEGETYSVSRGAFNRLGTEWVYVSATPLKALTEPVVFISRLIVGFSCFGLLLAVVLSWFASKRLYSPVARLVKLLGGKSAASRPEDGDEFEMIESVWNHVTRESQTLQTRLESQLPQVREGFLLQLAQGYLYYLSESDLQERMGNLGWEVKSSRFNVVYVQLLGFSSLQGRFSEGDEVLVTFAASNIVQELAANAFDQADTINFHDLTIGLLLGYDALEPLEQCRERIYRLLNELTNRLNLLLHMRVAIGLGRPAAQLKEIPAMLEETKQALRFRDLQEDNQIIDLREWVTDGEKTSDFPFHLEKEVIHGLRMGLEEETVDAVRRFLHELRVHAGKELWVQQGMLHLLGSVQHSIMQMGMNLNALYEGANLYSQLCQLKEPEEIEKWFLSRVILPFMHESKRKQDAFMQQTIDRIVLKIQDSYMEELSLDAIAESERLSSYTLSRMFKQSVGLNFIDYLTEIRLNKAKELLLHTDWRLNEVAERVGYQHSYFSRIFKKHVGVTPSRYRENSRDESTGGRNNNISE
ncbi:helix-turn-helix domain-containing protein [Paenibacillus sp. FSL H8-0034]|uniref:helix-turn-helix domain-containing protein n=1 Tax=Paenibacillus sp. FSL H8-0034 TaxID=2954671 RepID=UPI0030FC583F